MWRAISGFYNALLFLSIGCLQDRYPDFHLYSGVHDVNGVFPGLDRNGNNRPEGKYSSVEEIVPPVDDNGNYAFTPGSTYGPEEPTWIYKVGN